DMDFAALKSITAYESYTRFQPKESDGSRFLSSDVRFGSKIKQFSQELRLVSESGGTLEWIAGAYFSSDSVKEDPARIQYMDDSLFTRSQVEYDQSSKHVSAYG